RTSHCRKVVCDVDLDGTFSAADTPLAGIEVDITSQDVSPGQLFTGTTDGTGSYNVPLPAPTDHYLVELANLPGSFTIVIPGGGTYLVLIITGNSNTDHRDDVDFLVQGCRASNPDGRFRLGKGVMFADGTNLIGDTVQVGNGLSVSSGTRC